MAACAATREICRCGRFHRHDLPMEKTISIGKPRESVGGFDGKVLYRWNPVFAVTAATKASRMSSSSTLLLRHRLISDSIFSAPGRCRAKIFRRSSWPADSCLLSRSASRGDNARKQTSGCVSRNSNYSSPLYTEHCRKSSTSAIFEAIAQVCDDKGPPVISRLFFLPASLPNFLYSSIA